MTAGCYCDHTHAGFSVFQGMYRGEALTGVGFVFFLASCLPYIPEKGTVGASGDLAPLSHLALGLIGEGKMWSPKSGWADAKYVRLVQLIAFFSASWLICQIACSFERKRAFAQINNR